MKNCKSQKYDNLFDDFFFWFNIATIDFGIFVNEKKQEICSLNKNVNICKEKLNKEKHFISEKL